MQYKVIQSTQRRFSLQIVSINFDPKCGLYKDQNRFIDSLNEPYFVVHRNFRLFGEEIIVL